MTLDEAQAPLKAGEARLPCVSGLLIRRAVRKIAVFMGVRFYEDKGWLESTFIFRGPADRVIALKAELKQRFGE